MSQEIVAQLLAIRDELDASNEFLCAAHLQMVIDKLTPVVP
jgi:hypothetical protein